MKQVNYTHFQIQSTQTVLLADWKKNPDWKKNFFAVFARL